MRLEIAIARHGAGEFVFHFCATIVDLTHQHQNRLHHVQRFETSDNDGLVIVVGKRLVGLAANHGGNVRRTNEAIQRDPVLSLQNSMHGGWGQYVVAQNTEVLQAFDSGLFDSNGRGRRGRFEADGEEHYPAFRIIARDLQRILRRIDHAYISAERLGLEQRQAVGGWHAQGVGIGAQNHVIVARQTDCLINAADG